MVTRQIVIKIPTDSSYTLGNHLDYLIEVLREAGEGWAVATAQTWVDEVHALGIMSDKRAADTAALALSNYDRTY